MASFHDKGIFDDAVAASSDDGGYQKQTKLKPLGRPMDSSIPNVMFKSVPIANNSTPAFDMKKPLPESKIPKISASRERINLVVEANKALDIPLEQ